MNIQLIKGQFNAKDTVDLITQMVHIKVKYLENKTNNSSSEEDIKFRESKIKRLQNELFEFRHSIDEKNNHVKREAIIQIEL